MSISKLNGTAWSSIVKVDGITKASIAKVAGISAGPSIQYATLNATKYATYDKYSTTSWAIAVGSISSDNSQTSNLYINSQVFPTRTGTGYLNSRTNVQFDLSSYSAYTILSMTLTVNVTGITVNDVQSKFFAMDLGGNTFSFPTTANSDYSIYKQSGNITAYIDGEGIDSTGEWELPMTATAVTTANTFPSAFSMALVTKYDKDEAEPNLNAQYYVVFDAPKLNIAYQ